jgi:putative salt-induced outer membrane protein YdiY
MPRGFVYTLAAFALAALAIARPAAADELVLSNGDRLTGTVGGMSKGKLTFNSALAGTVTVPWKDVASLVSETPVKVERRDESEVKGTLAATESGQIAVRDESGQVVPVAMTETASIATAPKLWKGDLVAGMNIQRGNAERTAGAVDVRTVRRTELDRLTLGATWGSSRERSRDGNATTTRSEVLGGGQYDYFFTKRLYGLANVSGEHDRVEGVDYRVISGLGVGYQFYDTESLMLNAEIGPSYVIENFDDGTRNSYLAARIAWNVEAVLVPNVTAFHRAQLLPSLTTYPDFLAKTQTGLRATLIWGFFGEAKLLWDYNSNPSDDNERQDVTYQLGLGWGF